jgi:outer membrane protein assembly factor BamE (lipoprotein component of BamABCDE complex)
MRLRAAALTSVIMLALFAASCSGLKFGRDFPSPKLDSIVNGRTAKADLVRMFGDPTQVGVKDGDQTWTWYYAKQGGKEEFAKQLDVTFNNQGVVKSHSFSSSFPEDMKVR